MSNQKDQALVKLISEQDDREALKILIERYQAPLERYLFRIGVNNHDCDDVLQNTMIKMYININSYNELKGTFSSWLYRITHNEAQSFFKKNKRSLTVDDESWWEAIKSDEDLGESANNSQLKGAISTALNKLNQKYSEPLTLHFLEGKSYQEISYILKIPTSTVGVRINRGKAKLKVTLKQWKGDA